MRDDITRRLPISCRAHITCSGRIFASEIEIIYLRALLAARASAQPATALHWAARSIHNPNLEELGAQLVTQSETPFSQSPSETSHGRDGKPSIASHPPTAEKPMKNLLSTRQDKNTWVPPPEKSDAGRFVPDEDLNITPNACLRPRCKSELRL